MIHSPEVGMYENPSLSLLEMYKWKTSIKCYRNLQSNLKSVSHDSVFNPEQHPGQSDPESALSVPQMPVVITSGIGLQANIMQVIFSKIFLNTYLLFL